jgi:large subunit ribosomal protein L10
MKPKPHINKEKKRQLDVVKKLIKDHKIVAVVDFENLPARPLQVMREKLRGKVKIFMTKKRLIRIALKEMGKEKTSLGNLDENMRGMAAILVTEENPFSLYKTIKKSKSAAPAKGGQIAPKDIEVKAGPTGFAPGPIIGELGGLKIKAGIDGGKVVIKADSVVCKEGDEISSALAAVLTRLNIMPMEIGLDVRAVWEDGTIYTRSVLDIDEDKFLADLALAGQHAINLSIEIGVPTKDTVTIMIEKAARDGLGLATAQDIMTEKTTPNLLAKAERQAKALQSYGG